jgi:hypothetical protein
MKSLLLLLVLLPVAAFAQTPGPLVVERVRNPVVVAPDYKVTDLDGELGQLVGGYAGKLIDGSLFLGGAGYWLANGSHGDELGYGGFMLGWTMPAGSRIRFGGRGLVGFGVGQLGQDVQVVRGRTSGGRGGAPQIGTVRVLASEDFFVFEPQADFVTRLSTHVGVNLAAGYRLTGFADHLDDRLNGTTGSVALQLAW